MAEALLSQRQNDRSLEEIGDAHVHFLRKFAFWLSLLLIFSMPWDNMVEFAGLGTAAKGIGFALAACWILATLVTGRIRRPHPFHIVFFLFVLWHCASVFWTIDLDATLARLQTYVLLMALVYILWDLYQTPRELQAGLQAYVVGAWVSIGSLVFNFITGTKTGYYRYSALGFGEGNIGVILTLGIPVAWYLFTAKGKIGQFINLLNLLYIPAASFAILLTASRTSLLAALPGVLFIAMSINRAQIHVRILALLTLVSALFVLLPLVPQGTLQRLATTSEQIAEFDLNRRDTIWRAGVDVFIQNPVLGVGSSAFSSSIESGRAAHNSYLQILVEMGLVGFILFAIAIAMVVRSAIRQPKYIRRFWLAVLMVLAIGVSSLNWAHRKQAWLFPALVIVSAGFTVRQSDPTYIKKQRSKDSAR